MIKHRIAKDKLLATIAKAYDLSTPQGFGFLHYREGPIPDDVLSGLVSSLEDGVIGIGYVQGRSVKLGIYSDKEGWYLVDHECPACGGMTMATPSLKSC